MLHLISLAHHGSSTCALLHRHLGAPTAPASAPDAMHLHGLRLGEDAVKSGDNPMYLHLLKDTANTGLCLDGTPAASTFSRE